MRSRGFKMILMGAVALLALSAVVMLLWNWLIPSIAGLSPISYWQALGLFALCRILFGGLGFGKMGHRHPIDHHKLHEKWHNMTDEERREFIEKRRGSMRGRPFPGPRHHHHARRDEHDDFAENND